MKAILFDLDGVFYQGEQLIPGAAETATWVKDCNIPHLFVTNTSSRPRSALLEKLSVMQIYTDISHLFTPLVATRQWLVSNNIEKVALYIPQPCKTELHEFVEDESTPEAIVIGDLGRDWDYDTLNNIFRLLMKNPELPLIALGMTRYWRAEDGLRLDVAPFIKALEFASGIIAKVMGKPSIDFYNAALVKTGYPSVEVVMIGDDIRGDIEGAQQAGLKAVLVKTGKYRESDIQLGIMPDCILESVSDLKKVWPEF